MTDGDKAAAATLAAAHCSARGATKIADLLDAYEAVLSEMDSREKAKKKPVMRVKTGY